MKKKLMVVLAASFLLFGAGVMGSASANEATPQQSELPTVY
ncbi:hypothetical protein V1502_18990 [Bacillus sp. SCS-153A]